jgi:hypothetical protein
MADGHTYLPASCRVCGGFAWRDMSEPGKPPVCAVCTERGDKSVLSAVVNRLIVEGVEPIVEQPTARALQDRSEQPSLF